MKDNSSTPETDAEMHRHTFSEHAWTEFARQLELSRDEWKEKHRKAQVFAGGLLLNLVEDTCDFVLELEDKYGKECIEAIELRRLLAKVHNLLTRGP